MQFLAIPDSKGKVDKQIDFLHWHIDIKYTGSKGNMNGLDDIGFDCGVGARIATSFYKDKKYMCITHEHGDHVNEAGIRATLKKYPYMTLIVPYDTYVSKLKTIPHKRVILVKDGDIVDLKDTKTSKNRKLHVVAGKHSVPVVGYVLVEDDDEGVERVAMYATDTYCYEKFKKWKFDLIMSEGNYDVVKFERNKKQVQDTFDSDDFAMTATRMDYAKLNGRLSRILGSEVHSSKQNNIKFQISQAKGPYSCLITLHMSESMY